MCHVPVCPPVRVGTGAPAECWWHQPDPGGESQLSAGSELRPAQPVGQQRGQTGKEYVQHCSMSLTKPSVRCVNIVVQISVTDGWLAPLHPYFCSSSYLPPPFNLSLSGEPVLSSEEHWSRRHRELSGGSGCTTSFLRWGGLSAQRPRLHPAVPQCPQW